ncbi:hypothetical protein B0H17DRAFT_1209003 [Mycena rosella]|uniref:Uncharacterized protein n=1 Tax=Mycena rosella TaxID=1033263 RepID=A0AAD7CZG9_MYCRO|nr:hypothetical protein B0H17DRAFT_1209003 [Mycena rosella]
MTPSETLTHGVFPPSLCSLFKNRPAPPRPRPSYGSRSGSVLRVYVNFIFFLLLLRLLRRADLSRVISRSCLDPGHTPARGEAVADSIPALSHVPRWMIVNAVPCHCQRVGARYAPPFIQPARLVRSSFLFGLPIIRIPATRPCALGLWALGSGFWVLGAWRNSHSVRAGSSEGGAGHAQRAAR